jgi:outer membrane protein assembly factor BamA
MLRRFALLVLLVAGAAHAAAQAAASFFIESIEVAGGSRATDHIIIAESRLRLMQEYTEGDLRNAVARIQRLPFIVSTDFRLEKGTQVGRYVLLIRVRRMTPLFLDSETTSTWSERVVGPPVGSTDPTVSHVLRRLDDNHVVAGARAFLGANIVATATAEKRSFQNDRYTLTFSKYDLFGSRASLTAILSYSQYPCCLRSGAPDAENDWHHRDNITEELVAVVPVTDTDSLRGSWQHYEFPVRFNERSPETGQFHYVLLSRPEITKDLVWIHDTTNDPLLPTEGTRWTFGGTRVETVSQTGTGYSLAENRQFDVSWERSFPVTFHGMETQSLTIGGSGQQINRILQLFRPFATYAFDLPHPLYGGDVRLQISGWKQFSRIRQRPMPLVTSQGSLAAGIIYRNVWGVLRLNLEYDGWERP